jgi:hypothetical protein
MRLRRRMVVLKWGRVSGKASEVLFAGEVVPDRREEKIEVQKIFKEEGEEARRRGNRGPFIPVGEASRGEEDRGHQLDPHEGSPVPGRQTPLWQSRRYARESFLHCRLARVSADGGPGPVL